MGVNNVFGSTHISTASIASELHAQLPHNLAGTSSKLWPSTTATASAFKSPLSLAPTSHAITNPAHAPSSPTREIKAALLNLTTANPLTDHFSAAQRGADKALPKLAMGAVQSAYNVFDGVFKLNQKINLVGDIAPDWLKNLAETNQKQQISDGEAVASFVKNLPSTLSNLPANALQTLSSLKNVDVRNMMAGIDAEKMGGVMAVAAFAITSPNKPNLVLVQGQQKVKQALTVSQQSMQELSGLFRKEHSQGNWTLGYGSKATNTQFNATVKKDTLEFDFSTLRARASNQNSVTNARVNHHYSDNDIIQAPDGTMATVKTSGRADHIQAELLGASLERLSKEGVKVNHIKVGVDALETNQSGTKKLLQQLESSGFSNSSVNALESVKDSLLVQVLRDKGFDLPRLHIDTSGNVAGVVFSKSARSD